MKTKVAIIKSIIYQLNIIANVTVGSFMKNVKTKNIANLYSHKNQKIFIAFVDIFQLTEEL